MNETFRFSGDSGHVLFVATVTDLQPFLVRLVVDEVVSWDAETHEPSDLERRLSCMIKWDGCSHVWFGERDDSWGYLHLCGVDSWREHIAMLEWLYRTATGLIVGMDEDEKMKEKS